MPKELSDDEIVKRLQDIGLTYDQFAHPDLLLQNIETYRKLQKEGFPIDNMRTSYPTSIRLFDAFYNKAGAIENKLFGKPIYSDIPKSGLTLKNLVDNYKNMKKTNNVTLHPEVFVNPVLNGNIFRDPRIIDKLIYKKHTPYLEGS